MGDDMDGCECVWAHEFAMQRLLAFIRQNQDACTDTECIDVSGRTLQSSTNSEGNSFNITMIFLILAMFMYIFNPSTWNQLSSNKPNRRRDNNPNGGPPPPAIN